MGASAKAGLQLWQASFDQPALITSSKACVTPKEAGMAQSAGGVLPAKSAKCWLLSIDSASGSMLADASARGQSADGVAVLILLSLTDGQGCSSDWPWEPL